MLVTLAYHGLGEGKRANRKRLLERHLEHIAEKSFTYLPGESLKKIGSFKRVCLTFDDARLDFYEEIFPLLIDYRLCATLAVPVGLVGAEGYCTWDQLRDMRYYKGLKFASHSYSHIDLTGSGVDLDKELVLSKKVLEEELGCEIDTFVYPYGKFSRKVHREAKKHYTYLMRLGGALNFNWFNANKLIYRIPGDDLPYYDYPFKEEDLVVAGLKSCWNLLRGK